MELVVSQGFGNCKVQGGGVVVSKWFTSWKWHSCTITRQLCCKAALMSFSWASSIIFSYDAVRSIILFLLFNWFPLFNIIEDSYCTWGMSFWITVIMVVSQVQCHYFSAPFRLLKQITWSTYTVLCGLQYIVSPHGTVFVFINKNTHLLFKSSLENDQSYCDVVAAVFCMNSYYS